MSYRLQRLCSAVFRVIIANQNFNCFDARALRGDGECIAAKLCGGDDGRVGDVTAGRRPCETSSSRRPRPRGETNGGAAS